uniref:Predicted protein n=1 Tax=Hordeum vulgare subsp. vulgare TaxID=112509 RepID=F2E6F1_HORVV|nr:predicted protein [Hordeum vulgare subsp. vulgare]
MKPTIIILAFLTISSFYAYPVSIFYCGFGGDFCGQSTTDDVNPKAKFVILAFANPQSDGSVLVDDANFPADLVKSWQASGKKVLLSIGGQNGNWPFVFGSDASVNTFVSTMASALDKYGLDGVDLDIENYQATPRTVVNAIKLLRAAIGDNRIIVVSP